MTTGHARLFAAALFLTTMGTMVCPVLADDALIPGETRVTYSAADIAGWQQVAFEGQSVQAGPSVGSSDKEINLHRVTVHYTGEGKVSVAVAHSTSDDLRRALAKKSTAGTMRSAPDGRQVKHSSAYKGEHFAWVILKIEGDVTVESIDYVYHQATNTLYGHIPLEFAFGGAKLPYRLMLPRGYDPAAEPDKRYPLVISVAGSGSIGTDNVKNMEMFILAQHLYTRYYDNPDFACFSVVPQIPSVSHIPPPYYPADPNGKGAPTALHPDWPTVNAEGWFTQASLAMVRALVADPRLKIDPDRVYYTGFSYGGKAGWEFLKADPDLFAGAIIAAGWPIGRAYANPTGTLLAALKREVLIYKRVPISIYAGDRDAMRFGSKAAYECLIEAGGKATYTEIENTTHLQTASRTWGYTSHIKWLFDQKRQRKTKDSSEK